MSDESDDNTPSAPHEQTSAAADPYGVDCGDVDPRVAEAATQRVLTMQHNLEQAEGDDLDEGLVGQRPIA